jgi:hypothetical protein
MLRSASPVCCHRVSGGWPLTHSNQQRLTAHVESAWGAVLGLLLARFPRPLAE